MTSLVSVLCNSVRPRLCPREVDGTGSSRHSPSRTSTELRPPVLYLHPHSLSPLFLLRLRTHSLPVASTSHSDSLPSKLLLLPNSKPAQLKGTDNLHVPSSVPQSSHYVVRPRVPIDPAGGGRGSTCVEAGIIASEDTDLSPYTTSAGPETSQGRAVE